MICEKCGREYNEVYEKECVVCRRKATMAAFIALIKAVIYTVAFVAIQFAVQLVFVIVKAFGAILSGASDTDAFDLIMDTLFSSVCKMTAVSSLVTILAVGLFFLLRKKVATREVWLKPVKNSALGLAALFGAAAQLIISVAVEFVPWPEAWIEDLASLNDFIIVETLPWQILAVVLLGPITEELIFRGLVYTRLRQATTPLVAAVLSGIAFGAVHGNMIQFFYAFTLGVVLALIMERYHSLLPCIIVHIFFNGVSFLPYYELPAGGFILVYLAAIAAAIYTAYQIWFNKKDIQTERNTPDETV